MERRGVQPLMLVVQREKRQLVAAVMDKILVGKINQHVGCRRTVLKDRLASFEITIEGGKIVPQSAIRTHVSGCIEQPAGPFGVLRRIGNAVEKQMVHATQEQKVRRLLEQRGRDLEMFLQPGE